MPYCPSLPQCCGTLFGYETNHIDVNVPVVSSGSILVTTTASGPSSVSYQIIATNSPTSYAATSLPTGMSIDTSTGLISGNIANTPALYVVPISGTNSFGTGTNYLTITVKRIYVFDIILAVRGAVSPVVVVSTDGSPYATMVPGNYSAYSQIKFKTTDSGLIDFSTSPNPTISCGFGFPLTGGLPTLLAGSSLNASALVVGVPSPGNSLGVFNYLYNGSTGPSASIDSSSTGFKQASLDISGTNLSPYSAIFQLWQGTNGQVSNGTQETILNF